MKAQDIQKVRIDKHMPNNTDNENITTYKIKDYVLVEYPPTNLKKGPPAKSLTSLRGPMKIIGITNNSHHTVQDLVTNKYDDVIFICNLSWINIFRIVIK